MATRTEALPRLAILGDEPAFARPLHVGAPAIPDRERLFARLDAALDRRRLTNRGPLVEEFEARIAALAGTRHAVAVCNGTVGLELAARAVGLSGEVIVPAFTFVATAHALAWIGLEPVLCDVDPRTHCLDPRVVEAAITPRTSGILAVHLWGRPAAVSELQAIADRFGLRLLFDGAHAFAARCGDRPVGGQGDATVFSFHATKFLSAAEGGAVVTDDDAVARRLRLLQNFGFAGVDRVVDEGTNGKMSELAAAFGLTSLDDLDALLAVNRRRLATWRRELADIPGLSPVIWGTADARNDQYCVVEVDPARTGLTRDQLVAVLRAENVLARRYFHPGLHRMEPYRSRPPAGGWRLPATERLCERVLVLPTGAAVSDEQIVRMADILRRAVAAGPALARTLEGMEHRVEALVSRPLRRGAGR